MNSVFRERVRFHSILKHFNPGGAHGMQRRSNEPCLTVHGSLFSVSFVFPSRIFPHLSKWSRRSPKVSRIVSEKSYSTCNTLLLKSRRTTISASSSALRFDRRAFFEAAGIIRVSWPNRTGEFRIAHRICKVHLPCNIFVTCVTVRIYETHFSSMSSITLAFPRAESIFQIILRMSVVGQGIGGLRRPSATDTVIVDSLWLGARWLIDITDAFSFQLEAKVA